jgi:hypothetical protein
VTGWPTSSAYETQMCVIGRIVAMVDSAHLSEWTIAHTFDHSNGFNQHYIRLADIDGSGTTDILYVGAEEAWTCI